jgi:hypothetical protein
MERLEHRMIPRIDKLGHDAALGWLHLGDHGLMNGILFALLRIAPPPH